MRGLGECNGIADTVPSTQEMVNLQGQLTPRASCAGPEETVPWECAGQAAPG